MSESKTPRTDAIAHAGYEAVTYIGRMTALARDLERELDEQCRLNGKGAEREAALLGRVERLERELTNNTK